MRRNSGFTLIEIMVTMAIVGTVLALVVLKLDHLSPKYALRAGAREVGATIDLARGTAAGRGRRTAIVYRPSEGRYELYAETLDGRKEKGPWGFELVGSTRSLPRGVHFRSIYAHAKGAATQQSGTPTVRFDPLSIEGSHMVYLENDEQKQMSVKYNALLGSCDYTDGIAEFESGPE